MHSTVKRNRRGQNGLTLIELLITMTFVSILGVIGTPMYQGYRVKAKVGTSIVTVAPIQRLAAEYYSIEGLWPADNAEAGASEPTAYATEYIQSLSLTDSPAAGSILITFDNTVLRALGNNNTLVFYPVEDNSGGSIRWECDAGTLKERYRPTNCRL